VPVLTKGRSGQCINEVEISEADKKWKERSWKSIQYNYGAARYFDNYQGFFRDLYGVRNWTRLAGLNVHIIRYISQILEIDTELVLASDLGVPGRGTQLLLGICQKLGADTYISGAFGREYLDESPFIHQGIQVEFQDFHHPKYEQVYEPFIPQMSVVDLLFNCGYRSKELINTL
jgi:hypothetical protein